MLTTMARLADRVLEVVVPKAQAGACPCNDAYCTTIGCRHDNRSGPIQGYWYVRYNCDCSENRAYCTCSL
jgi:hypothetical protein